MTLDDTSVVWFALRERRSSLRERSKLNESSSRRQTFAAAMQQFEEQMTAAKVVTAVTRPLNLYYGLTQAGLAVMAAHVTEPWGFSRHGLKLADTKPELPDIFVRPEGEGGFQAVAASTGSTAIDSPVSLGALWASLPDLCQQAPLHNSNHAPALDLSVHTDLSSVFQGVSQVRPPRADLYLDGILPEGAEARSQWLTELTSKYPGAAGAAFAGDSSDSFERIEKLERYEVRLRWQSPNPAPALSDEELDDFFDAFAPQYLYRHERYLRPSVEEGQKPAPSPLMTWWLLLYSFSMLARYQPRKWVALLDVDKSRYAVSLQYALEVALSTVPHLVLEALDTKPRLHARPIRF